MRAEAWHVRPLEKADNEKFVGLLEQFFDEILSRDPYLRPAPDWRTRVQNDISHWIDDEQHAILLLCNANDIVGFIDAEHTEWPPLYVTGREVFIRHLYVVPACRRQGGATRLVEAVRAWAATQSVERLRLGVLHHEARALGFWKSQGGRPWTTSLVIPLDEVPRPEVPEARDFGFR